MHTEINVQLTFGFDDNKTIPLTILAEQLTERNIESVVLEELIESLDTSGVEALYGEKHAHGSGDPRYQPAGADTRTAVWLSLVRQVMVSRLPSRLKSPRQARLLTNRSSFQELVSLRIEN